jgi:hypothetical protein
MCLSGLNFSRCRRLRSSVFCSIVLFASQFNRIKLLPRFLSSAVLFRSWCLTLRTNIGSVNCAFESQGKLLWNTNSQLHLSIRLFVSPSVCPSPDSVTSINIMGRKWPIFVERRMACSHSARQFFRTPGHEQRHRDGGENLCGRKNSILSVFEMWNWN